jgi:hypothetical protein
MPNVYKTAQGKTINMDTLRLQNEKTVAVGNAAVNARGDQVMPNGNIVKTKQEIMKDHYQPIEQNITNNKR